MSIAYRYGCITRAMGSQEGEVAGPSNNFNNKIISERQQEENVMIRSIISDKINKWLDDEKSGEDDYIFKDAILREFELRTRDKLRMNFTRMNSAIEDISRNTSSNLLSFPTQFLDLKLYDLIQMTDNPDSVEELFQRISELPAVEDYQQRKLLDEDSLSTDEEVSVDNDTATVSGSETESQNSKLSVWLSRRKEKPVPQDKEIPPPDFKSLGLFEENEGIEGENIPATNFNSTSSSEEIFCTPMSSSTIHESVNPVCKMNPTNNQQQPFSFPVPDSQRAVGLKTPIASSAPVFQFVGNPNKEPRLVKPGEILFSATGSPIVRQLEREPVPGPSSIFTDCSRVTTPIMATGRPIRLKVDNPGGGSIQVDLVCRGVAPEEDEIFRNFVTDVRGLITTRSMMHNKLMAPRVPNSQSSKSTTNLKRGGGRKPLWKN